MGRIVVGVDGSEASVRALSWAVAEARLRDAQVDAIHVWSYPPMAPLVEIVPPPVLATDELVAAAQGVLDHASAQVDSHGVELRRLVVEGAPSQRLLEATEGAELVVVGPRGHGGFVGLLLGSVSEQLAHHAPCPVVIVR